MAPRLQLSDLFSVIELAIYLISFPAITRLNHSWNKVSLWKDKLQTHTTLRSQAATRSQFRETGTIETSRRGRSGLVFGFAIFIMIQSTLHQFWGEGWNTVAGVPRAGTTDECEFFQTAAKTCDILPLVSTSSPSRLPVRSIHKRSFKRACRRALQHGFAWYHGRSMSLSEFPEALKQSLRTAGTCTNLGSQQPPTGAMTPAKRIKVFHWNPSGLTKWKLDEIVQWLDINQLDLAVLSETHWRFNNSWNLGQWHVVHSGHELDRTGGVMILVRRSFCNANHISWQSVVDGRILHVRLNGFTRSVDVVGCYQHAAQRTTKRHQLRQAFWKALDDYLQQLPQRNVLIMTGDFNCTAHAMSGQVGHEVFRWKDQLHASAPHPDSAAFQTLIADHGIVALNTWNATIGPSYINGPHASRIDFAFTRPMYADGPARDVQMLPDVPFLSHPHAGHVPMICHLPALRMQGPKPLPPNIPCQVRQNGYAAWKAQDQKWHQFSMSAATSFDTFTHEVECSDPSNMTQLHHHMFPLIHDTFNSSNSTCMVSPTEVEHCVLNKWDHFKAVKILTQNRCTSGLDKWFRCWFHLARHRSLAREHKRYAAQVRKQKFLDMLQAAAIAAQQHDAHRLHQIIKRHAPKAPKRPIHLRTAGGALAHPHEELAIFKQHVHDVWYSPDPIPNLHDCAPGVPFSEIELQQAFSHVPLHKAVARPFMPGLFVRALAEPLARYLYPLLQRWWGQQPPIWPQDWKDGWLCFLRKPGKTPNTPNNLRPICLQEPLGKAIVGLLTKRALKQVYPELCGWPQFAYTPKRSANDALTRVAMHCRTVRTLTQENNASIHSRAHGFTPYRTCGGLQLFVDLSRAFDNVPRTELFPELCNYGMSDDIANLLTSLHTGTQYHLFHSGEYHAIQTGKGVRQGCKVAPLLWCCYMLRFMHAVADRLGPAWVKSNLTLFADDLHIGVIFHSSEEFYETIQTLGTVLDILEDLGMTINLSKTAAQMKVAGTSFRKHVAQVVTRTTDGACIQIPRQKGSASVHLEQRTKYLGVLVSYGAFEEQTIATRLSAGITAFRRLRPWLIRKQIQLKHRLRLWHTCIFPVLTYGIFPIGLTYSGLHKLQQLMYKQLRHVIGDHSYCTRHTHQEALAKHSCATPLQRLLTAVQALSKSIHDRHHELLSHDIVHRNSWTVLEQAARLIDLELRQGPDVPLVLDPDTAPQTKRLFQCPTCQFASDNLPNLRRHCTNIHGDTRFRTQQVDLANNALMGLPQCRICFASFTTWRSFRTHLERGVCQVPGPFPPLQTLAQVPSPAATTDHPLFEPCQESDLEAFDRLLEPDPLIDMSLLDRQTLKVTLHVTDLSYLRSTPYGQWLMDLVNSRAWDALSEANEICDSLTDHCMLCGIYTGRLQVLISHLKLYHADHMQHAHCKSAQLTRRLVTTSPCRFCKKTFKSSHVCPVLLQTSLLLTSGGGLDAIDGLTNVHSILHCELCAQDFENVAEVHQHMRQAHKLAMHVWNASRDSIIGSPACAHCGSLHESKEGLRRHILYGHCTAFDPTKPAEVLSVDPDLLQAIQTGTLTQVLQDSAQRMALTLSCQCCGESYQRGTDLSAHLQQCHGSTWHDSTMTLRFMTDTLMRSLGCVCNPGGSAASTNLVAHTCVGLRQLAMLFVRSKETLFVPFPFDRTVVEQALSQCINNPVISNMTNLLLSRSFEAILKDAECLGHLRSTCLQCGAAMHPADLCGHLHQDHLQPSTIREHHHTQLYHLLKSDLQHSHVCTVCNLQFDTPGQLDALDHAQAARAHLRGTCPVLTQLAWLLTLASDGNGPGLSGPTGSGISGNRSPADDGSAPAVEPASNCQTAKRPRRPSAESGSRTTSRGKSHGTDASDAGHNSGATRSRTPGHAKTRLLHLLHANRAVGHPDPNDGESKGLASNEAGKQGPDQGSALETVPDAASHDRAPDSHSEGACRGTGRSIATDPSEEWTALGRRQLAVPEMVPSEQEAADCNTNPSLSENLGETSHGLRGSPSRRELGRAVSCPEESRSTSQDDSLAPENEPTRPRQLWHHDHTGQQQPVAGTGSDHEAPQSTSASSLPTDPRLGPSDQTQEGEGQGQRQERLVMPSTSGPNDPHPATAICRTMLSLILSNDSNWCFANAATLAFLWATLSRAAFQLTDWGQHASMLRSLLCDHGGFETKLAQLPFFQALLAKWKFLARPQDAAEYTSFLLAGLGLPIFQQCWERRLLEQNEIKKFDSSGNFQPLRLQFPDDTEASSFFTLQSLINSWSQDNGMVAAVTHAPPLLCLQIDRAGQDMWGQMVKLTHRVSFFRELRMPVFTDSSLQCTSHTYIVVAVVAHMGNDLHTGHYQALMKAQVCDSTQVGIQWFIADDNVPMKPSFEEVEMFVSNATLLWLCRLDQVSLFHRFALRSDTQSLGSQSHSPNAFEVLQYF